MHALLQRRKLTLSCFIVPAEQSRYQDSVLGNTALHQRLREYLAYALRTKRIYVLAAIDTHRTKAATGYDRRSLKAPFFDGEYMQDTWAKVRGYGVFEVPGRGTGKAITEREMLEDTMADLEDMDIGEEGAQSDDQGDEPATDEMQRRASFYLNEDSDSSDDGESEADEPCTEFGGPAFMQSVVDHIGSGADIVRYEVVGTYRSLLLARRLLAQAQESERGFSMAIGRFQGVEQGVERFQSRLDVLDGLHDALKDTVRRGPAQGQINGFDPAFGVLFQGMEGCKAQGAALSQETDRARDHAMIGLGELAIHARASAQATATAQSEVNALSDSLRNLLATL